MWTLSLVGVVSQAEADIPEVVVRGRELAGLRAGEAPPLTDEAIAEALAGRVASGVTRVDGVAAAKAWAVAVVDAPVEATWMAINDESRAAKHMPVEVAAVIGGTSRQTPRRVFEYLPLPIVSDRWWVVDLTANAKLYEASGRRIWELSWRDATDSDALEGTGWEEKAQQGHPVAWTRGAWVLYDLGDERTLVEHFSWSDPGGSVPAGVASRFAGRALRDTLDAVSTLSAEAESLSRSGFTRPDGGPL